MWPPLTPQRRDLQVHVGPRPYQRQPRQPILLIDQLPNSSKLLGSHYPSCSREIRSSDLPSNRAGGNRDLRIVADPLVLAQMRTCHYVEFPGIFGEPHGRRHSGATLAKADQADVLLAVDLGRNRARHKPILIRRLPEAVGSQKSNDKLKKEFSGLLYGRHICPRGAGQK